MLFKNFVEYSNKEHSCKFSLVFKYKFPAIAKSEYIEL